MKIKRQTESPWIREARAAFSANNQRMTRPRLQVMCVLDAAQRPLKAEEIRREAGLAETDLVTVYRNLEALRQLHMVQRIVLEDGVQLFEAVRADRHFHHVVCRVCHKAEPLDACAGHELEQQASRMGYQAVTHVIEVFGVCGDCARRQAAAVKADPRTP